MFGFHARCYVQIGQRQLLCLARAMLNNPPVFILCDLSVDTAVASAPLLSCEHAVFRL